MSQSSIALIMYNNPQQCRMIVVKCWHVLFVIIDRDNNKKTVPYADTR